MLHVVKLDTLLPESREDYEAIYTRLLRNGGYIGPLKYYEPQASHEYPSVEAGDTVLLGGSRLNASANDQFTIDLLQFTKALLDCESVKLIGVCYGHQIIARALGSTVGRAPKWELGVAPLQLTEAGKSVYRELDSGDGLQQCHADQVFDLPEGCELLASTPDCPIQSFSWRNRVLCVQGHPEFSQEIVRQCITRVANINREAADQGLQTYELPQEGTNFGYAFARLVMSHS